MFTWWGVFAPLHRTGDREATSPVEIGKALAAPTCRTSGWRNGANLPPVTAEEFRTFIGKELPAKYARIVKESGIKVGELGRCATTLRCRQIAGCGASTTLAAFYVRNHCVRRRQYP